MHLDKLTPSLSPLSMWTSKIFFWRRIFRPPHALQRSLWLILCPWPWQLLHTVDTCWTIPGMSWCMRTCMPVPWQVMHTCAAPFRLPRPAKKKKLSARWITRMEAIFVLGLACYIRCGELELDHIYKTDLFCYWTKSLFMACLSLRVLKSLLGLLNKSSDGH